MIELTRRGLLGTGAALALPFPAIAQAAEGLNAVAKAKGMRFGSCVAWGPPGADRGSFANPGYAALLKRDCGVLVPENEFKWQAIRPDAKTFNLDHFSDMLDYAEASGMAMRGHTLLWHKTQYFPKWLNDHDFGASPAKEAERILGTHIRTLCKLYASRIVSFDVVNETVEEGTGALRTSSLSRAFGGTEAMLDFAYHTAREHAPGVELVYNDYMSWEPGNEGHRTGVLKLLEGFRKRGIPCDTLGVQSHIGLTGDGTVGALVHRQEGPWRGFLDSAVQMGYKLAITEFDVNDKALPTDAKVRDGIVANYAAAYLEILFSYPQLRDVLAWGMCDRFTWLNGFTPRKDGTRQRATPYDAEYRPKALYGVIRDAFAGAAAR
ncbi:endo-1,4-beta-xylanase [Sphingomonas leidyi]|uniref:Beta-xylanase n=1 Tax=Sphingomonas leidyi TaxID=68569 RepID=A0A7X5ZYL4_9SPHN|nr:endo-1,4-beta-xylanase [Sphingomonas leidyi]NIJ67543.1 endo-1,4-beta-xylanase [Sphingomonas leidyi]